MSSSSPSVSQPPPTRNRSRKVPDRLIKELTAVFRMLSDKNRLRIVLALAHNGPMHVKALCKLVTQTQPAVSHHLTLMRSIGLIDYNRVGKMNQYYLASDYLCELLRRFFTATGGRGSQLDFTEFSLLFQLRSDN
ncbi:MAG: transcriptional regulator [Planctomycetia bacterium]|nr:transcriptional regulator [Planctomycetia bacterium]